MQCLTYKGEHIKVTIQKKLVWSFEGAKRDSEARIARNKMVDPTSEILLAFPQNLTHF
jgi:hypothetical protein